MPLRLEVVSTLDRRVARAIAAESLIALLS